MENKWTDVSYCVFKSSFYSPALWNHLTVGGKRVRSCLTRAERTGKDRKCLSEARGRGGEWNGTGTDFKGQYCLYCPTPFFFPRVVFEKCEKKRQQEKVMERWWEADNDWDSQESPQTLTDCLFVFVPRVSLCQSGNCKASFQGVSRCRLSPSLLNSGRPLKQVAVQLIEIAAT